jgi:hypothetical protein
MDEIFLYNVEVEVRLSILFLVYILDYGSSYCMTRVPLSLLAQVVIHLWCLVQILADMFVQIFVACDIHQYVKLSHNFFFGRPFRIIIYQSYNLVLHFH